MLTTSHCSTQWAVSALSWQACVRDTWPCHCHSHEYVCLCECACVCVCVPQVLKIIIEEKERGKVSGGGKDGVDTNNSAHHSTPPPGHTDGQQTQDTPMGGHSQPDEGLMSAGTDTQPSQTPGPGDAQAPQDADPLRAQSRRTEVRDTHLPYTLALQSPRRIVITHMHTQVRLVSGYRTCMWARDTHATHARASIWLVCCDSCVCVHVCSQGDLGSGEHMDTDGPGPAAVPPPPASPPRTSGDGGGSDEPMEESPAFGTGTHTHGAPDSNGHGHIAGT